MKTDNQPTKKTKSDGVVKLYALTILMFSLIVIAVLGGGQLIGLISLPHKLQAYIGAALIGYVVVGAFVVTHLGAKFMLNKKG